MTAVSSRSYCVTGQVADVLESNSRQLTSDLLSKKVNGDIQPRTNTTLLQFLIWLTRRHFGGFNYSSVSGEPAAVQCASKHKGNREQLVGLVEMSKACCFLLKRQHFYLSENPDFLNKSLPGIT